MYYVYSLRCKDGYYIGCTDNLRERIERHQKGQVPATANRLPISLEFYFAVSDRYKAFEFEKYLKSGSGRAFINKHLILTRKGFEQKVPEDGLLGTDSKF